MMSSNFSRPEFLGRLRTPKTMKIIAGVTSAAAMAPGLPTIDSDDLGKLRTALLDKTELRRFKRSSGNASSSSPSINSAAPSTAVSVPSAGSPAITAGLSVPAASPQTSRPASAPPTAPSNAPQSVGLGNTTASSVAPTSAHLSIPSTIFRPATPATASLEKDINDVRTAMEEFKSKQLKYTKKDGTVIPLSETIDSVLNRIRQYTNIGNIMVQSDPAIAALAWGGFNLLLQIAGNDAEMTIKIAESMADILEYVKIYQTYETAFKYHNTAAGKTAYDLIMLLHKDIRGFCQQAKQYYEKNWARRMAEAAITPFSIEFDPLLQQLKNHRQLVESAVASARFHDKERINLLKWLSQIPYHDIHDNERKRRSENTCDWLLQRDQFTHWRDSARSSLLWVHGKPGCGKSVLISKVIDHLVEIHGSNTTSFPVAYFYCNFDDHKTLQPANVLATLLKQIVATRPSMPEAITAAFKMQQLHGMVSGKHSFEDVKSYFSEVLKSTEIRTAFLLLDGVDECPSTPKGQGRSLDSRGQLLNALVELTALQLGNSRIKVLVSSRLDSDIQFILKPFPDIAVEQSDTRDDIAEYVGSQLTRYIQEGMPVRRPIDDHPELRALIIDSLIEKSQGMFLYAHLQLATICQEHTLTAVKEALDQLPDSYDEVYLRILTKLEAHTPRNRLLAKRVIAWVLCAVRPLSVAELTEALIVRIPERRLDQEGRCSGEAILEVCMSLIVAETQGGNTVFRFAHFSVKEFFHQHSLAPEPRSKSNFIIDTEKTHDEIAEICVGYLSFDPFLRGPLDYETLYECRDLFEAFIQEHPLLDYAGAAWTEHLRKNLGENETLSASISNLFASTANIGLSFQVYWFRTLADGFPKGATPLHIASFFGLPDPLETLLLLAETGAINATDSLGRTPLHWACLKGHSAVVQRLLEAGVEMKALDKKGFNPMGLAALSGQTKTFKILLQVQRDMIDTEKDQQLGIALLAAAQGKSREIVSLLLDAGADPNVPVHPDMDPLWVAAWEGDLTIVEQLLEAGANVDSGRKYGNALQEAAASGSLEIIEVLLMAGADVNARGGPAGTALNAAAFRGYYECVELLLIAGAEVRFPDDAYGGARTLAEAMEHSNVVKLLLEYAPETSTPNETLPQTTINGILQLAEPAAPLTQPSPSPTNLIQLEAMNAGARSLFQTVETGDVETARRMVGFGANFISSALASGDVAFIERFYQVIIYQVDTIQNLKNTELMGLLFELFEGFYTGVMQSSVDKELLLDGFRTAMGIAMQKLLDGDYAPMMRGLVVHREKKLLGVIENRDEDAAERSLRFAAEWIRIGIRVPGHSLIARGFAKLYVAGLKALEDKGFQALANQILQSSVCGTKQEELVGLYEIGTAARLGGCSVAETRIRQVAAGLLQGDAADGVDEKFRQRLRDILSPPPDISGETSPEWGDDEIPWWDVYRTSS